MVVVRCFDSMQTKTNDYGVGVLSDNIPITISNSIQEKNAKTLSINTMLGIFGR